VRVRAVVDTWINWEHNEIHLQVGQEWDSGHPLVEAYPEWFELAPATLTDHLAAQKPVAKKGK
jgi:hypothetical protein